jgi:hypothetical protein
VRSDEINQAIADHVGVCMRYSDDLNAIRDAENMILLNNGCMPSKWYSALKQACANLDTERATARQRAEAFLRTVGKWNGGKL